MKLTFTVPGQPQGKQRPRVGTIAGHARLFTPEKTVNYESLISHAAQVAMAGRPLIQGACCVSVSIDCQIPASWSGKRQRLALSGAILPTTKPDLDNVLKSLADGMNSVVWRDDVQMVSVRARKRYAEVPCVRVDVWPIEERCAMPAAGRQPEQSISVPNPDGTANSASFADVPF